MKAVFSFTILGFLACAAAASAQEPRTERVRFERGESGATLKGRIKGDETVHYVLGAKSGQSIVVILNTDNNANYFNIFAPGKKPGQDEAMFIGSTEGTRSPRLV